MRMNLPSFPGIAAAVTKAAWGWQRARRVGEWNRKEDPARAPQKCAQLTRCNSNSGEEGSLRSKWCWSNGTSVGKKTNLGLDPAPYTKSNSKWSTNLNMKHNT